QHHRENGARPLRSARKKNTNRGRSEEMDFSFTEEQTLLRNTVQSLLSDKYDFDTRRKVAKSADGWRPEIWAQFAELGLLAAPFSEEMGGLGGGAIETMIVMEEFGRHLVIE